MLTDLMPLATYCFVMSSTPGPNNVMLAASGANFGYRRALPQILGTNSGVALQTLLTCLGLGSVFTAFPVLHQALRIAGALYLVFLAYRLSGLSFAPGSQSAAPAVPTVPEGGAMLTGSAAATAPATPQARPLTFAQAVLFQAVNPKSWVKSITLATVFMPPGLSVPVAALLVAFIGLVIGFPSASMWTLFGVMLRGFLAKPGHQRVFNLAMAALLLLLALSFFR